MISEHSVSDLACVFEILGDTRASVRGRAIQKELLELGNSRGRCYLGSKIGKTVADLQRGQMRRRDVVVVGLMFEKLAMSVKVSGGASLAEIVFNYDETICPKTLW